MFNDLIYKLDKERLIELLPKWQQPYFSDVQLNFNRESLIEYIIESKNELLDNSEFLAGIVQKLSHEEYFNFIESTKKLNIYLFNKSKLVDDILSNNIKIVQKRTLQNFFDYEDKAQNFVEFDLKSISPISDRFYELLDYQMFIKEKLLSILESNFLLPRVLIHMPTGTGKTKTAVHTLIHYFINVKKNNGLIFWIAHTNVLLDQALGTFENVWSHLGNKPVSIFKVFGGKDITELTSSESSGIVFCNISSLINLKKNKLELFDNLSSRTHLVIFDEAHKVLASETSYVINSFMLKKDGYVNKALIGLTATPGRNIFDEDDNYRLAQFFERRIIQIDINTIDKFSKNDFEYVNQADRDSKIVKYFQDRKILSRFRREILDYNFNQEFESLLLDRIRIKQKFDDYNSALLDLFAINLDRNVSIVNRLIELDRECTPTIFFACSVEHGKLVHSILKAKGVKTSQVYAETSKQKRDSEINDFKKGYTKILINVSVLTTGFDSTNIRCVFIARPTKSIVLYSQMIGRGLRGPKMGGNEDCLLIDMKDNLERFSDENDAFSFFEEYWR